MALSFDEIWVYGGQLVVAKPLTNPKALGEGLSKIDWSAYIQGSLQVGAVDDFGEGDYPGTATVMVGRTDTKETPLSINTRGNVLIEGGSGAKDEPNCAAIAEAADNAKEKPPEPEYEEVPILNARGIQTGIQKVLKG